MEKLSKLSTLETVAEDRDWNIGTGFEAGSSTYQQTHSPDLANLPYLNTNRLEPFYVSSEDLKEYQGEPYFKHPRDFNQYQPPLVTIRASATRRRSEPGASRGVKAAFHQQAISYRSGIVGISGEEEDSDILRLITLVLNSSIAQYWLFMSAAGWGIGRDTIRQSELRSIPVPLDRLLEHKDHLLQLADTIDSLIVKEGRNNEYRKCVREIDHVLYDAFGFSNSERLMIESRVNFLIDFYHRKHNSDAAKSIQEDQLLQYGRVLCGEINKFLKFSEYTLSPTIYSFSGQPVPLNLITLELNREKVMQEEIVESQQALEGKLREIDEDTLENSIYARRVLELYQDDSIHIIRPNEVRFWTLGEAINDAPEIVGELLD